MLNRINQIQFVFLTALFAFTFLPARSQRIVRTINLSWTFESNQYPGITEIVNIPHTWNNKDAFQDGKKYYRGIGTRCGIEFFFHNC